MGMPAMGMWAGTWRCFSPSMCPHSARPSCLPQPESQSLGREVGARPSESWAILLVILCPAASLCSRALQGPPACVPMPAGSPFWLCVPLLPRSPPWLPIPTQSVVFILAACPCTILSSLYRLWDPTLAVDAHTSSVPMQAVRPCTSSVPKGRGSHSATPGQRGHPCKQRVLSSREPGLMATHELPGRERG